MKIVNMQCPNCGARLTVENNMYVCNSCGTSIAIDYDESDVAYERAKNEVELEEKRHAHEKELLERNFELQQKAQIESEKRQIKRERQASAKKAVNVWIKRLISLLIMAGFFYGSYRLYKYMRDIYGVDYYSGGGAVATPTPMPNYNITPDDIKDDLDTFIETGKKIQMQIDQCAVKSGNGVMHFFDKTDAVFLDAYIVSNIPDEPASQSTRLVLIYQVTWYNEDDGEQICYDAVYFDGIKVNPNGGIISNYSGQTIMRSDAAWGWSMEYSFEEYSQCYLENVKALGGTVTEVVINSSFSTDTVETEETEPVDTEEAEEEYYEEV